MLLLLAYLALGAGAGIVSGLLGVGGGIVIVPALYYLFVSQAFAASTVMQVAVGTSLATVVFTASASARAHHRRGAVQWPMVARLVPGMVGGAIVGALIAHALPSAALRSVFGVFELLVALQVATSMTPPAHRSLPGGVGLAGAGTGIGALSTIVGIGGGSLTVPFLLWCNVDMRHAVATSSACGVPVAAAGAIGMAVTGLGHADLPGWSTGYVHWPAVAGIMATSMLFAPLGARVAHAVPIVALRRMFAVVLAVVGLRMVF